MKSSTMHTCFISPSRTKPLSEWKRNPALLHRFVNQGNSFPNTFTSSGSRLFLNLEDLALAPPFPVSVSELDDYGPLMSVSVLVLLLGLYGLSQLLNKTGFDEVDPIGTVSEDDTNTIMSLSIEKEPIAEISSENMGDQALEMEEVIKMKEVIEMKEMKELEEVTEIEAFEDTVDDNDIVESEKETIPTFSTSEKIEVREESFSNTIEVTNISDEAIIEEDEVEQFPMEEETVESLSFTVEEETKTEVSSSMEVVNQIRSTMENSIDALMKEAAKINVEKEQHKDLAAMKSKKEREDVEELKKILRMQERERKELQQIKKELPIFSTSESDGAVAVLQVQEAKQVQEVEPFQEVQEVHYVEEVQHVEEVHHVQYAQHVQEVKEISTGLKISSANKSLGFFLGKKKLFFVAFLLVLGKRAVTFAVAKSLV